MNEEGFDMMRHLDLFSGIGGFALAARMVGGIETAAFCEIDKYCQRVLRKNFPNVPIHNNVKNLKGDEYGPIDIITAGYPCQPFSHAGKRSGANDDRHLWPEVFRITRSIKPRWLLLENVAGHITLGLDDVLSDLDSIGYTAQPFIVPACAVDAKHRRDRVWIVAHSNRAGRGKGNMQMEGRTSEQPYRTGKFMADLNCERLQRSGHGWNASGSIGLCGGAWWDKKQTIHPTGATWTPEPAVGRVANGIPNRVDRLRGLGNAIVPQVAAVILDAIRETDQYFNQP